MTEKPILFSAPMVRAILDGRKTQTRRACKHQHWSYSELHDVNKEGFVVKKNLPEVSCPYGFVGGRLWVRETCATQHKYYHLPPRMIPRDAPIHYAATEDRGGLMWRPSIFMPRWASRITLEITGVRVERVNEISEEDAKAEGIECGDGKNEGFFATYPKDEEYPGWTNDPRDSFHSLWDSINAKRGFGWEKSPRVWVLEFRRLNAESDVERRVEPHAVPRRSENFPK